MCKGNFDTYFNPEVADDGTVDTNTHPPQPEMWICSDTYWTWSIQDGVKYHPTGIPLGYE